MGPGKHTKRNIYIYYEIQGKRIRDEDRYFRTPNEVANFLQLRRFYKSLDLVKDVLKSGLLWLDIGCGNGLIIREIASVCRSKNININIVGLDVAESKIKRFKRCFPFVSFVIGDALALPFRDTSFSMVTCFELMEHFHKKEGLTLLSKIYRVLKPKGILIISTPSYYSAREFLARRSGNLGEHKYIYKPKELKLILESNGFDILKHTSSGFMFPAHLLSWEITGIILKTIPSLLIQLEKVLDKISFLRTLNWTTFFVARVKK